MLKRPIYAPSKGRKDRAKEPSLYFEEPTARVSLERRTSRVFRPPCATEVLAPKRRPASARGTPTFTRNAVVVQRKGRKFVRPRSAIGSRSVKRSSVTSHKPGKDASQDREEKKRVALSLSVRAALLAHQHKISFPKVTRVDPTPITQRTIKRATEISSEKTQYLLREYMTGMKACPFPANSPRHAVGKGFDRVRDEVLKSWINKLTSQPIRSPCVRSSPENVAGGEGCSNVVDRIASHIESSYLLTKMSTDSVLPNALSSALCVESLKQLAEMEPEYRNILLSSAAILEAGVFNLQNHHGRAQKSEDGARDGESGKSSHTMQKLLDYETYHSAYERLKKENADLRVKAEKYDSLIKESGPTAIVKLVKALPSAKARKRALVEVLRVLKSNAEIGTADLVDVLPPILEDTEPQELAHFLSVILDADVSENGKRRFDRAESEGVRGVASGSTKNRLKVKQGERKSEILAHMLRNNSEAFVRVFEKHGRLLNELIIPTAKADRDGVFSQVIERMPIIVAQTLWSSPVRFCMSLKSTAGHSTVLHP